jgi:hypothetical protein
MDILSMSAKSKRLCRVGELEVPTNGNLREEELILVSETFPLLD